MGSLCNSSNATTSTYAPTAAAQSTYQDILSRAQQVASTPYQPYTGQLTAGLTPTQQAGINNTNSGVGMAVPYINTAGQYAATGAAPVNNVSSSDIVKYLSPYQQNVIDSTMANINETNAQQQQQVKGNAALQGALGGDRVGVAQAELARQQGLASNQTLAGLQNQNYTQAVTEANSQQQNQQMNAQRAAQGAFTFGNLGTTAQNSWLQGAQAQLGAGAVQQGTQQTDLNAQYQQYLNQLAFPYQQTQFLAGVGLPTGGAMGGTQTTTPPQPNQFSQYAGLGLAAAGLFLKHGGRVGYADGGGAPFNFITDTSGYVPKIAITAPQQHQMSNPSGATSPNPTAGIAQGLQGLHGAFGGSGAGSPMGIAPSYYSADPGGSWSGVGGGTGLSGYGGLYAKGGLVEAVHAIRKSLRRGRGYDDGGGVPDDFNSRFLGDDSPSFSPAAADASPLPVLSEDALGLGQPVNWTNPALQADSGQASPVMAQGAPQDDGSSPALGYAPERSQESFSPFSMGRPSLGSAAPINVDTRRSLFGRPLDDTRMALISAGLGIAGGTSPSGLTNIAQGAQQGLKALQEERKAAQADIHVGNEGRRLAMQAEQFAKNLGLNQDKLAETKRQHQDTLAEQKRLHDVTMMTPRSMGVDPVTGSTVMGLPDPSTGQLRPIDPHTGTFMKADQSAAPSTENLTGQAYLDSLPPAQQTIVKGLAEYDINPNTLSTRNNRKELMTAAAKRFNPEYRSDLYPARASAVQSFSKGPQANTIRSFDVAISHLNTLDGLATALNNKDMKAYNAVANTFKDQFGYTAPGNFDAAKAIVGDEIVKAVVGSSAGALADREEIKKNITNAKTPEQLKGVIQTYKTLMAGQLHGFKKQYEDTTGLKNFENRLSPETLKELAVTPAGAGAPTIRSKSEYDALPAGATFVGDDGKSYRKP